MTNTEPPLPAVHSCPPPALIMRNIHTDEIFMALGLGVAAYFIGAYHRQPRVLRSTNKYLFGVTGLFGSLFYILSTTCYHYRSLTSLYRSFFYFYENSANRLMGRKENATEVCHPLASPPSN